MKLSKFQFSTVEKISPGSFDPNTRKLVGSVSEFRYNAYEYIQDNESVYKKWVSGGRPGSYGTERNIAVLYIVYKKLCISNSAFPIAANVMLQDPYVLSCPEGKTLDANKLSEGKLEEKLEKRINIDEGGKYTNVGLENKNSGSETLSKIRENCQKYEGKIERLRNRKMVWKKEMVEWYNRYYNHQDFSEEHPEMIRYFEIKKKVKEQMKKLKQIYKENDELLKKAEDEVIIID